MPTYDYHCDTCGKDFEWFQSITAPKLTVCPEQVCTAATKAAGQVHRKISGGTGIIFNGDGFYLTDYVKNSNGKSSNAAPSSASSNGTSDRASENNASVSKSTSSEASSATSTPQTGTAS